MLALWVIEELKTVCDSTRARVAAQPVAILAQDTTEIDLTRPETTVVSAGPMDAGPRTLRRDADVEFRATTVTLRPPWRRDEKLPPVTLNAVLVREIDPPSGEEPVEWILLTDLPIGNAEQVRQVVDYYCLRWGIETFFRTLKPGCRIEHRRFEHIDRGLPCLALCMIVAWRTLYVCHLGRSCPDVSCEVVFEPEQWKAVHTVVRREPPPSVAPTLPEMVRMVARLGGVAFAEMITR